VRGLNQSLSAIARATAAAQRTRVNGASENSLRWAEDLGLPALFDFLELVA